MPSAPTCAGGRLTSRSSGRNGRWTIWPDRGGRRSSPAGAQHQLELLDEEVRALPRDAERRLDLEHVQVVARGLHDDPELAHPLADRLGDLGRRLARLAVRDELDARVE